LENEDKPSKLPAITRITAEVSKQKSEIQRGVQKLKKTTPTFLLRAQAKKISVLLIVACFLGGSLAAKPFTTLSAETQIAIASPETQGNYEVENMFLQFSSLKHHGEALGWSNPESQGAPDPSSSNHYQGLVRYPGKGVPIFYVTQKDDDKGGYLHIIRFGTRSTTGERLRSNLQIIGRDTAETYPDPADTWLKSIRFDGSLIIDGTFLPAYVHPGGMAIIEDILFMALDTPIVDSSPPGQIVLFDLSELANGRENPTPIQAIALNHKIDNLGIAKLNDDYIIWVNGDGGRVTKFYKTSSSNLRDNNLGLVKIQDWDPSSIDDYDGNGDPFPSGSGAHQSSALIRETGGDLYLIGMRHPGGLPWIGSDYADLYRVDSKPDGGFKLTHFLTKHFYCVYDGGQSGGTGSDMRIGNFAAAENAYVSPSGELILYSIPHDDEDWADPDFTKLGEFRHWDVNCENSPLRLPTVDAHGPYAVNEGASVTLNGFGGLPADRPWVELYDDNHWEDRSIMVDYDDRMNFELNNFNNLDNFNDKSSSVRWRSPVGLDIELYDDDNFRDRYIILRGTGETEYIADLETQVVVPGVVEHPGKGSGERLAFNDKTSSMRFVGNVLNYLLSINWDLDGDYLFGETGSSALYGDEVGSNPLFDASDLDGPSNVSVTLKVTGSDFVTETTIVNIINVPPFVDAGPDIVVPLGQEVAFTATYTDPGESWEEYNYTVNWGDKPISLIIPLPAYGGQISLSHLYSEEGIYTVKLRVTDKDGGVGTDNLKVKVGNFTSFELSWRNLYTVLISNAPPIIIGTAAACIAVAVGVALYRRRRAH
jgi:hypothetical protein